MVTELSINGTVLYQHAAWADSLDGVSLYLEPNENARYIGGVTNDNPAEIVNFGAYEWVPIDADDESDVPQQIAELQGAANITSDALNTLNETVITDETSEGIWADVYAGGNWNEIFVG